MTGNGTKQSIDALRQLEANLDQFLREEEAKRAETPAVDSAALDSSPPEDAAGNAIHTDDAPEPSVAVDVAPEPSDAAAAAPIIRVSDPVTTLSQAPPVNPAPARSAAEDFAAPSNAPEIRLEMARWSDTTPGALPAPAIRPEPLALSSADAVESPQAPEVKAEPPQARESQVETLPAAEPAAPKHNVTRKAARKAAVAAGRSGALPSRRIWLGRARRVATIVLPVCGVIILAIAALWWRLMSGPIALDLATPWITAAIAENFGGEHRVEIGGTQLERDEDGRPRLRILDIVVRDADGTIVASAPKAEVAVSGTSLLTSRIRAERLSLVGAEMAVRIESDGHVTVFAGADKKRPIATASAQARPGGPALAALPPAAKPEASPTAAAPARGSLPNVSALLGWIDGLSASGLDGHELSELGLKNGNLVVDDRRTGKQWSFDKIDVSLNRGKDGGIGFSVSSEDAVRPWRLKMGFAPAPNGNRVLALEADRVSLKDILLALRFGEGQYEADIPLTARIVAEIGPDGVPQLIEGRIVSEQGGKITQPGVEPTLINTFETTINWDRSRQSMVAPFQIVSGGNRITLFSQLDAPSEASGIWTLRLTGGSIVLASAVKQEEPIVFNRFLLRLRIDPEKRRLDVEQGEIGNLDFGIALSGSVDYSASDPHLAIGVAGNRMPLATLKKLWPAFINPGVRDWVLDNVHVATVDRAIIATNASLASLGGSPDVALADGGLSVEIAGTGATVTPVEGLPAIREADVLVRATGRTASVSIKRGIVEMSGGRKLTLSDGVFEVPDTASDSPPARVRFKMEGPLAAAAEVLALPAMKDSMGGITLDPATTRGTLSAQVNLGVTLNSDPAKTPMTYSLGADFTNFAADRALMGQKIEAANLRVTATQTGYQAKGDVKLSGIPAILDYRKQHRENEAEVRIQASLDDAARNRLGFQVGPAIVGVVPVKMTGRIPVDDQNSSRFAVDADLGPAKVDNLIPGWQKPAGKPARATFNLYRFPQSTRFDDMAIEGSGALVRGSVELDASGDVLSANFPVFSMADGDKTVLKADRGPDGALRVTMRGDVYDGRALVKSLVAGSPSDKNAQPIKDLDVDIKLGTVAGHHGETVRALDLKMSRRAGVIRSFSLSGKLGRDASLSGDLRGRGVDRKVLFIESGDAGALFRFTDTYAKLQGGEMWVAMDPPGANNAPQDGLLNIRNFAVRGEAALDRVASGGASARNGVEFSTTRVEFTKTPGKFVVRDGVVRGPMIGATIDGVLDYQTNEVHMRGTFVPLYSLNNMFGQIPIVGLFLGGGTNEGLVGITYEVVGAPSAPVLRVNPISAIAPGLLRKFFEFPTSAPQSYAEPVPAR